MGGKGRKFYPSRSVFDATDREQRMHTVFGGSCSIIVGAYNIYTFVLGVGSARCSCIPPETAVAHILVIVIIVASSWQSGKAVIVFTIAIVIPATYCFKPLSNICSTDTINYHFLPLGSAWQMPARGTYCISHFPVVKPAVLNVSSLDELGGTATELLLVGTLLEEGNASTLEEEFSTSLEELDAASKRGR